MCHPKEDQRSRVILRPQPKNLSPDTGGTCLKYKEILRAAQDDKGVVGGLFGGKSSVDAYSG